MLQQNKLTLYSLVVKYGFGNPFHVKLIVLRVRHIKNLSRVKLLHQLAEYIGTFGLLIQFVIFLSLKGCSAFLFTTTKQRRWID